MSAYHVPVLVDAVVSLLTPTPPGVWVDGTMGGGGHTAALVEAARGERVVVGIDRDRDALAAAEARLGSDPLRSTPGGANVRFVHGAFSELGAHVDRAIGPDAKVAGILLDLGVSSHQLDVPARGFAWRHASAPLDMRMDVSSGKPTARELIATLEVPELARVLREFGEVRDAGRLADRMKAAEAAGQLSTAGELVRVVEGGTNPAARRLHVHPATLIFQALRIAVNDELGELERAIASAATRLVPGGRLVVISYHSLEDRRVKHAFVEGERGPARPAKLPPPSDWRPSWEVVTRHAIVPSEAEIAANPRARSAKLRAAARAGGVRGAA